MFSNYWLRWTLNCAMGELLGVGAAGAIAYYFMHVLGEPENLQEKMIILIAMMVAGMIEGSLLGYLQWRILREKFSSMPKKEWMKYTILVAILGWFLGMLPSLFFVPSQTTSQVEIDAIDFDQPALFALLSIGAGLILGALFGLFQWFSLRKHAMKASKWIVANALGWGLGLGWIYIFASLPNEGSSIYNLIGVGMAGGILAGLSVGAITGLFLNKLEIRSNNWN